MNKQKIHFKGFTLVELIVVITILAILSTVAFISFQWYSQSSRDAVRQTNLKSLDKWLSLLKMKNQSFPEPAWPTTSVEVNSALISTQWFMSEAIANTIGVFWDLKDPTTWYLPIYVLSADKQKYQIGMFQEQPLEISMLHNLSSFAKQNQYFISAWDKIWVILSQDRVPVNATNTPTVDILNTTQTYLAYIDHSTKVEGTGESLYQMNPNYDCARIFEDSTKASWEYIINPKWQDIQVYCHRNYPDRTFYDYFVDGNFEDSTSTVWESDHKTTAAAYEWNYGLEYSKYHNVSNQNYTYINPSKQYKISWMFRSVWTEQSRLYYGFAEYDENFQFIANTHVNNVAGTETVLTEDVNPGDQTITFENTGWTMCDTWWNHSTFDTHAVVAFDIDETGNFNDLPNRNINPYNGPSYSDSWYGKSMRTITNNGETCTVQFSWTMIHTYPAWTHIRMHQSWGSYNYRGAGWSLVPNTWTKYEWSVQGISTNWAWTAQFRRWTVFVRPIILANHPYSSRDTVNFPKNEHMILQFDNLTLETY